MTLPAPYRINYCTNPSAASTTGYAANAGTGGAANLTNVSVHPWLGTTNNKVTWTTATSSVSGGVQYTESTGLTAGNPYGATLWVYSSKIQRLQPSIVFMNDVGTWINTLYGTVTIVAANTWTPLFVTGTAGAAVVGVLVRALAVSGTSGTNWAVGNSLEIDGVQIEDGLINTPHFNGDSTDDPSSHTSYSWAGAPNASISREDYAGVYAEVTGGVGMPTATLYAAGLGNTAVTCQITRSVTGDQWTVPGWRARSVTGADATVDTAVPYNVPVTYQLYVNGQAYNSFQLTVPSTTGYVCDPLQPGSAMPIATVNTPGMLSLAKPSLKKFTYDPHATHETPAGSRYPVARAGQRSAGNAISLQWYAHSNAVNDQFRQLVADAPILLFKPLPEWVTPSALMYIAAPVNEMPLDRDRGGQNTSWSVEGPLSQAMMQPPISGAPTYDAVATNLGSTAYLTVLSSSGYKRYVDIQANPLGLGS